ncbi:hypothetical protein [Microcoleus sp. MON2_D5]|uniref:hypothetical protein n=1 Tax=Microcoleus sp. MON2_D5 TaxID=2818833 RepID=UPI002FCFC6AD
MLPLHTQKSLDQLTWNEVQKLHSSLSLKATATTRTRRDYQNRIISAQPQPVVEPEHVATPLTCATCPLARRIDNDDNRYCCGLTDAVTRGHWEAKSDCYQELANLETEMTELIASSEIPVTEIASKGEVQPEALIAPVESAPKEAVTIQPVTATSDNAPPNCGDNGIAAETKKPYRYRWNQGWHSFTCWCDKCNPINPTVTGPEDEPPQGDNGRGRVEPTAIVSQKTAAYPQSAWPQPAWYIEMMAEIREYQKSLPDAPKPSKLYTKLCQEMEVGDYLKTDYEITRRKTQVVASKKILSDGRIHFILNCGISHREIFSEEVWLEAPAFTATATTDDAPPNRGDNGRGRVTTLTALPEATIVLPHATKPKADNNFMTAFTKESEGDRKFNDLAYLSQLEMEAQLAVERTVIGSEAEAIAYTHLRQIERDIEFYNRPVPEPQISPVVQQLETQMKELKTDVLSLFKITAFDPSILPTHDEDLDEQSATEIEPEGTIHWHSPTTGTIVGKKGALRNFYFRTRNALVYLDISNPATYEIMVVISADFTAAERKAPNIHHQRIRAAIEAGRTFNPKAFKDSPQFLAQTENYRGIGRIMQGLDGRWWAWANDGITGQPFPYENLALSYLDKIAERHQFAKQSITCTK